jgi:hypothetical protein
MKRILGTIAFVAIAFNVTGCSKGSPEEQAVKLFEEMATISDTNKADCDKMGEAIGTFMDKNAETFKKLKDLGKDETPEQKKAMEEKYGERMKAAMGKMMPAQAKCKDNKKLQDAMKKM